MTPIAKWLLLCAGVVLILLLAGEAVNWLTSYWRRRMERRQK